MYHIVAEARVRDAQRAAREWTEARTEHVQQQHANRLIEAIQRIAALSLSFLA